MEQVRTKQKDWGLTSEAFDTLLTWLDQDRQRAAQRYEEIRLRLITFFAARCHADVARLADETFNRVARRLMEGEIIKETPGAYFHGVARKVALESYRDPKETKTESLEPEIQEKLAVVISDPDRQEPSIWEHENAVECLRRCLNNLSEPERELVEKYLPRGEEGERKKNLIELAHQLNVTKKALRARAERRKNDLRRCIKDCLNSDASR